VSRLTDTRFPLLAGIVLLGLVAHAVAAVPRSGGLGKDSIEASRAVENGIKIRGDSSRANDFPTVIYSVPLASFAAREHVRIGTTVYTSYCAPTDVDPNDGDGNRGSPCIDAFDGNTSSPRRPTYRVDMELRLYKATKPTANADGQHFIARSGWRPCTVNRHHCSPTVTVDKSITNSRPGSDLFVNAEIAAYSTSDTRRRGDVLELEGDCYDPNASPSRATSYKHCVPLTVNQPHPRAYPILAHTKGQLSVVRFGEDYTAAAPHTFSTIRDSTLDINGDATVVHSTRLDNASGNIVEVDGRVRIHGKGFDHAVESWWLLTSDSSARRPVDETDRWISGRGTKNCLGPNSTINSPKSGDCSIRQVGAVTVPASASGPLFLNQMVNVKDRSMPPNPSATVRGDSLHVTCDPPAGVAACSSTPAP